MSDFMVSGPDYYNIVDKNSSLLWSGSESSADRNYFLVTDRGKMQAIKIFQSLKLKTETCKL